MFSFVKNVWETCTFSEEINTGDLKLHKFAVELHEFLAGKADPVYQDSALFLKNTFLTTDMKMMLKDSLLRISKGEGEPVTIIETGFGGGKTHSILLLHHIFHNKEIGKDYINKFNFAKDYGISEIPTANMITIDCRYLKKKTLWGEIASAAGKYDSVKEYDEKQQPINNIDIIKSFFEKPTLLLIDELPVYLVNADSTKIGNVTLSDLTINFITTLISAVSSTRNSCLILTLTQKQKLYDQYTEKLTNKIKSFRDFRADEISDNVREAISRQPRFIVPVSSLQVYDVIRTRLVKGIDEKEKEKSVGEFYRYYEEKGLIMEADYEEKIRAAYPFHPYLIDILYQRVSTIGKFNRTRGILRLLGLVLHNVYKKKKECKIVGTPEIDLTNSEIVEELTSKLDKDLKAVIDSDCLGHAKQMDSNKNVKLNEPIASTIYVHSLHGFTKKSGIRPSEMKLAVCSPGVDPGLVDRSLEDMEKIFWYVKKEGGEYYFDEAPNINAIIYSHKKDVTDKEAKDKIFKALHDLLPSKYGVSSIIWDEHELEDSDKLRIFVIDYKNNIDEEQTTKSYLNNILEHVPNGNIREKQNALTFLYPDKNGISSLIERAKILVAIEKARKDERVKLNKEYLKDIDSRHAESEHNLSSECFNVYCKVGYPDGPNPRLDVISTLDTKSNNLTDAMIELLKRKGKLIEEIGEDGIPDIQDKMRISKIYDGFKADKSKKFLLYSEALLEAAKSGIQHEKFGYADDLVEKDGKYEAKIGELVSTKWEGWLINKSLIKSKKVEEELPSTPSQPPTPTRFNYKIQCNSMEEIINNLANLPILMLNGKLRKSLWAELRSQPDTTITLKSELESHQEVKTLFQMISSRFSGHGYLTISSDIDLQKDFKKYDIKAVLE